MKREIKLQERNLEYILKMSKRSKQFRLTVQVDGGVVVTVPERAGLGFIERAILSKAKWILEKIEHFKKIGTFGKTILKRPRVNSKKARAHYLEHKEAARKLVHEKVEKFNAMYKFSYGTISIKNTKSRWGSCSRKGNLNFNYRLALLPERHAEYIVVHELCHLGEFNHSKRFWALVSKTVPEYATIHSELRRYNFNLS